MAKKLPIEAKRGDLFRIDPELVKIIGLDTKGAQDEAHPLFDRAGNERPLDPTLQTQLAEIGQIQPVTAQVLDYGGEQILAIEVGRQRVKNLRALNARRIAAQLEPLELLVVIAKNDLETSSLRKVAENQTRKVETVLEQAESIGALIARGHTNAEIAARLGIPASSVSDAYALYRAHHSVKTALKHGMLAHYGARTLARLPYDQQKAALENALQRTQPAIEEHQGDGSTEGEKTASPAPTAPKKITARDIQDGLQSKPRPLSPKEIAKIHALHSTGEIAVNPEEANLLAEAYAAILRAEEFAAKLGALRESKTLKNALDLLQTPEGKKAAAKAKNAI